MIPKPLVLLCQAFLLLLPVTLCAYYPDQHYVLRIDSLYQNIEGNDGIVLSSDGRSLMLQADRTNGSVTLKPQYSAYPYNQGLPSWNGTAPDAGSGFKIQMRFPYGGAWSTWLTVGYWKANVWSSYGSTTYGGGYVDIDYVKLYSYVSAWQFRIIMTRGNLQQPSPTVHKLSFFVSDSGTAGAMDFSQILNDKPAAVFVPTTFVYQYGVDPEIGGSICSPTTVSMILKSYGIPVDPLTFAKDTQDPYHGIFGVWPRVVQNASEYGLDGAVTRLRTWSQARDVLASGGRVGMSVGRPLYSGHLMMLAGFTAAGDPIVHDPARSNGYGYVFSKSDLSHSWFDKGGVAYTFVPATNNPSAVRQPEAQGVASAFQLMQNYPNPCNPATVIRYQLPTACSVRLVVYDLLGREVADLANATQQAGLHEVHFNGAGLASGVYVYRLDAGDYHATKRMTLLR